MELLPEQSQEGGALTRRVKLAKNAIETFLASSDFEITKDSVRDKDCTPAERNRTVREAKKVWEAMQDHDSRVSSIFSWWQKQSTCFPERRRQTRSIGDWRDSSLYCKLSSSYLCTA